METAPTWTLLLENLSSFFGRQPLPPKWLYNGAVLGLQGGTEKVKLFYVITIIGRFLNVFIYHLQLNINRLFILFFIFYYTKLFKTIRDFFVK